MASQLGASGAGPIGPALFGDSPDPSWSNLRSEAIATPTGLKLEENKRFPIHDVVNLAWSLIQQCISKYKTQFALRLCTAVVTKDTHYYSSIKKRALLAFDILETATLLKTRSCSAEDASLFFYTACCLLYGICMGFSVFLFNNAVQCNPLAIWCAPVQTIVVSRQQGTAAITRQSAFLQSG